MRRLLLILVTVAVWGQEPKSGPPLPHKLLRQWAQLPRGMNFGECSGVDIDKDDNVWVFNRGPHALIMFDRNGKMLEAWKDLPVKSSHGVRIDAEGNIWTVDVVGHSIIKFDRTGRVRLVIAQPSGRPGDNSSKDAFNRPTGMWFAPNGDFYVADGYDNSRVVKFNKDADYLMHWGSKGKGDGQFDLVHDVTLDSRGRVYVADRSNSRVQVFDQNGKFLTKWTDVGQPWGLYYVDRDKAIYMCDGKYNRVVKLNLEGQILGVLGAPGKVEGKFDFAHNIAVDSTGAIYVAEIKNWRVQKFAP